ncbi:MAG: hypothetical protein ABI920_04885 [Casimicrobiaceae bacterium]
MTLVHHSHDRFSHAHTARASRAAARVVLAADAARGGGGIVGMRGDRPREPRVMQ